MSNHQVELRREGNSTDQKSFSILSFQTDYLNTGGISGCGKNSERINIVQTKCTFFGGDNHSAEKCFKRIRKEEEKSRTAGDSDNRPTEHTTCECFRCISEDQIISKCPNPPKDNGK